MLLKASCCVSPQVVVSMTIPDWRALTDSLKITEPMISHEDVKSADRK